MKDTLTQRIVNLLKTGPKDCRELGNAIGKSPWRTRGLLTNLKRDGRVVVAKKGTPGRYGQPSTWKLIR